MLYNKSTPKLKGASIVMLTKANHSLDLDLSKNYEIIKRYINGKGKSIIRQITTGKELCVTPGEPCSFISFATGLHLLSMILERPREENIIYADYFLFIHHDKIYSFSKDTSCYYNKEKRYVRFYDPNRGKCQFFFKY